MKPISVIRKIAKEFGYELVIESGTMYKFFEFEGMQSMFGTDMAQLDKLAHALTFREVVLATVGEDVIKQDEGIDEVIGLRSWFERPEIDYGRFEKVKADNAAGFKYEPVYKPTGKVVECMLELSRSMRVPLEIVRRDGENLIQLPILDIPTDLYDLRNSWELGQLLTWRDDVMRNFTYSVVMEDQDVKEVKGLMELFAKHLDGERFPWMHKAADRTLLGYHWERKPTGEQVTFSPYFPCGKLINELGKRGCGVIVFKVDDKDDVFYFVTNAYRLRDYTYELVNLQQLADAYTIRDEAIHAVGKDAVMDDEDINHIMGFKGWLVQDITMLPGIVRVPSNNELGYKYEVAHESGTKRS